ncbi:S-layer homology domain-containing protein, partial [Paenibacillus cremeus]
MKKQVSSILSLALAFSMFSSVAMAATAPKSADDFTDLKDLDAATKAKFNAMISAGVYDGVKDNVFGLKDEMNRAQFAKVAALIFGLKVDTTLKTSSFKDVKADDPANGYALPYIEAIKAAGITDGVAEGQFDPAGKVTKEQLAAFLLRGLGKDVKGTTGVTDATVSDWAKGYVALALQLKLMDNGADGKFGGTTNALRELLVVSSYNAKQLFQPAKASVTEAKAVGYQTVQVTLDRDVDTTKAVLSLKKGTTDVATSVKWSDDKKSAILTLTDSRVFAGDYTVTLSGLDAAAVDKTTAKFTAENEVLKSINFVNAQDTVAYSSSVVVKMQAKNQYGENASFSAGSYSVTTSSANFVKMEKQTDGTLLMTLDTLMDGKTNTPGVSMVSVNVVNNDQHVTAQKNFKLGQTPFLS